MLDPLEALCQGHESKDVDYKAAIEWNTEDKKAACEIVKDILALTNTNGGYLVIGVAERNSKFEYAGVTQEQAESFETTKVNNFVNKYADPPINVIVRSISYESKEFVVIQVPPFPNTPSICQKEFPGTLTSPTIYVRTDNNESAPVKKSSDMNAVVENAVRNREDKILELVRGVLKKGASKPEPDDATIILKQIASATQKCRERNSAKNSVTLTLPHYEISFYPVKFASAKIAHQDIRRHVEQIQYMKSRKRYCGFNASDPNEVYNIQGGIEIFFNSFGYGNNIWGFFRLLESGLIYKCAALDHWALNKTNPNELDGATPILDIERFPTLVSESIWMMSNFYLITSDTALVAPTEDIRLEIRLKNVENLPLASSNWSVFLARHRALWTRCMEQEVVYETTHSAADWQAGLQEYVREICTKTYIMFNADISQFQSRLQEQTKGIGF